MPAGVKGFQKGNTAYKNRKGRRSNAQIADDLEKSLRNAADESMEITAKQAVDDFQKEVSEKYIETMQAFYADYIPRVYKRRYTFLNTKKYVKKIYEHKGSYVVGGIELKPEWITGMTYRSKRQSTKTNKSAGADFPATQVFKYMFEEGFHGSGPEGIYPVKHVMKPSPFWIMDRWIRAYAKDDGGKISKKLMNNVFKPTFIKKAKKIKR